MCVPSFYAAELAEMKPTPVERGRVLKSHFYRLAGRQKASERTNSVE